MSGAPVIPPSFVDRIERLDARLLSVGPSTRIVVIVLTVLVMLWQAAPQVPRAFVDYSHLPLLHRFAQPEGFGPDTIGDGYEARVVLHDVTDMYTKARLDETPTEAATWTKREAAPYPPAMLLTEAALYRLGELTGLQFYGVILLLAVVFLGLSLVYFANTRWYVFPLLYANFTYLGYRFVYVQDCSYIVMLNVVLAALLLARSRQSVAYVGMALAIVMKITPLFFAKNIFVMPKRSAWIFAALLVSGLVLPVFIWTNYLYIIGFHETVKGDRLGLVAAIVYAVPFAVGLWYADAKLGFDWEDRIGWSMVPVGMFLAMRMNVPRHLLMALLIPDKRAARNIVAAVALAFPTFWPDVFRYGAMLPISTVLLFGILISYFRRIGWQVALDDLRNPGRTVALLIGRATSFGALL
jgi:hypothetical protein